MTEHLFPGRGIGPAPVNPKAEKRSRARRDTDLCTCPSCCERCPERLAMRERKWKSLKRTISQGRAE